MTTATPNATSAYFVTIPIYSEMTVCRLTLPLVSLGMRDWSLLTLICSAILMVFILEAWEFVEEALDAIAKRSVSKLKRTTQTECTRPANAGYVILC